MPEYVIEHRKIFENRYLKVELKNNERLESVRELLNKLQSVKRANITDNNRKDITVYCSKFFEPKETEQEIKIHLDNFYGGSRLDPVFSDDNLSKISQLAYRQIIEHINRFGQNLEKFQSLFNKFDEEGFRDFFLPHLNSISTSHSATGETFNKNGKTDILIQDSNGVNVFIAECKIWHGEIEFLAAIASAKTTICKHSLFKNIVQENSPTSISCSFIKDPQKIIQLELILFNCK